MAAGALPRMPPRELTVLRPPALFRGKIRKEMGDWVTKKKEGRTCSKHSKGQIPLHLSTMHKAYSQGQKCQ